METGQILKDILPNIISRKEIFDVASDRGSGEGMQIEKWMLIEMLAKLKQRKDLHGVEGEHKYPAEEIKRPSNRRRSREHCDLWWQINDTKYWLEVKTIVLAKDKQRGLPQEIEKDLNKINRVSKRLSKDDQFYHLTVIFPVESEKAKGWNTNIKEVYYKENFKSIEDWNYHIDDNKLIIFILAGR